jgi:hypothetical protein
MSKRTTVYLRPEDETMILKIKRRENLASVTAAIRWAIKSVQAVK